MGKALVQMMTHPDHDIQERVLLCMIALAQHSETRPSLEKSQVLSAIQASRKKYAAVSIDADDDYRDILKEYLLLLADLEDMMRGDDRVEL